jgi:hypothetical protein
MAYAICYTLHGDGMQLKTNPMCCKCGLKIADSEFGNAYGDKCYVCYLKSIGHYASAIAIIKNNPYWWCYGKRKLLPVGWTIIPKIRLTQLFIAILKSETLNKTSKTDSDIGDYFTEWQLSLLRD